MKIIYLDSIDSTNAYAAKLLHNKKITSETCIIAKYQTAGKGQHDNKWLSEKGKNLLCSLIIFPEDLEAENQFYLNKTVALTAVECIRNFLPEAPVKIKWPNDIYIDDKKTGGILIQVAVQKNKIVHAIIGIGVNINQEKFPSNLPNPTSIFLWNNKKTIEIIEDFLKSFLQIFQEKFKTLERKNFTDIDKEYMRCLYKHSESATFLFNGQTIKAKILDVDKFGWIILETEDKTKLKADMNTCKMLIE